MVDLICCGAINWDINLFMERLPRSGEEISVEEIQRVSGGTAANVSVAAARILGKGRVAFIGALGKDRICESQISILEEEGVDHTSVLIVDGEESGQAYITIDGDGRNEIHTYFGANLSLTRQSLHHPSRLNQIKSGKVVVIMDPPLETAEELARLCSESHIEIIWDPGVYADLGIEALSQILKYVDYFILNQLEYENLIGTCDPIEVGDTLRSENQRIKAIIKSGEEGCVLCGGEFDKPITIEAIPLEQIGRKVVNTVGCGDAFIGAFASYKVIGYGDYEALRSGCAAGSFKASKKETRGSPTASELEDIIAEWNAVS